MTEYRDGTSAARARADEARSRTRRARVRLTADARARIPERLRDELAELEQVLDTEVDSLDDAERVEKAADTYEQRARDALNLLAQLEASGIERAPSRRLRKPIALVAATIVVLGALVYAQSSADADCRRSDACAERGACALAFPSHGLSLSCVVTDYGC